MQLNRNFKIQTVAGDLGLRSTKDPVRAILRHCERQIRKFMRDFPECSTLGALLDLAAAKLGTRFEKIDSDNRLEQVRSDYLRRGEKGFADLHEQLTSDVFGVTLRRISRKPWEPPYVSVIDCRGEKAFRLYFTKWHELGHLLILTDQLRLNFRRTHSVPNLKDPEEALVDIIAGHFGFFEDIVCKQAKGVRASFSGFDGLRRTLCPEASWQSARIGFAKSWPKPCLLIDAELGLRKRDQREQNQGRPAFQPHPSPDLRAVYVTPSGSAASAGLIVYRNMRVPRRSVIAKIHRGECASARSLENLDWWEVSDGLGLPSIPVHVEAQAVGDHVTALLTPA